MTLEYFKCVQCGECCRVRGYVHLTADECDSIAEHLELNVRDFIDTYTRVVDGRGGLSLIENADKSCVFINKDNTCIINKVKPGQCKRFPLDWSFDGWQDMCGGKKEESHNE